MTSKADAPDHRVACSDQEYSLAAYLRLNPSVAATYGIKKCHGLTRIGSMLTQTLQAQGMDIDWYKQLPLGAPAADAPGINAHAASFIKKVGRRPGNRLKGVMERLCEHEVAAPSDAAIRRRGGLSKASFPVLLWRLMINLVSNVTYYRTSNNV
jgi:hypothetical protein